MKHISKYNNFLISENASDSSEKQDIIDIFSDIIDDGKYSISLSSPGYKKVSNVDLYTDDKFFHPVYQAGNFKRSKFTLTVSSNGNKKYTDFISILSEMNSPISRLKDLGWNLTKLDTLSNISDPSLNVDCDILSVTYIFEKPDVKQIDPSFKPSYEGVRLLFNDIGLYTTSIQIKKIDHNDADWQIHVEFDPLGDDIPKNIEELFSELCDRLGSFYEYQDKYEVDIYF